MNSVSWPPDPAVIPSLIFNPIRDEDNPRYRGAAGRHFVQDLIPDGQLVTIVGEEGEGKSTLGWQIACEVSSGTSARYGLHVGSGARYSIRHAASLFRAQRRCSLHEPQLPRTVVDLPYEAINRHDIDAAASTFTDDVEYRAQESQIVGSVSGD